jgi:hypothetical protein
MTHRFKLAAALLCALAAAAPARAQVVSSAPPPPGATPGWTFNITPYAWLPTLSSQIQATGPRGGTVTTDISAGIGQYISDINFTTMIGGSVRYDRFSALTDFVYLNASLTSDVSHLSKLNLGPGPVYIPRSQQLDSGTRMSAAIWSLAGAYTLLQGDWGNIDAVGGLRMLSINSSSNYLLTADFITPDGTVGLSRNGNLSAGATYFEGIGGITGRINIPNSKFYLPFYFDAGGGALPFTWQAYGAVAYSAATWADVSVGYRYLSFENGGNTKVRNLSMGGAIIAGNFHF